MSKEILKVGVGKLKNSISLNVTDKTLMASGFLPTVNLYDNLSYANPVCYTQGISSNTRMVTPSVVNTRFVYNPLEYSNFYSPKIDISINLAGRAFLKKGVDVYTDDPNAWLLLQMLYEGEQLNPYYGVNNNFNYTKEYLADPIISQIWSQILDVTYIDASNGKPDGKRINNLTFDRLEIRQENVELLKVKIANSCNKSNLPSGEFTPYIEVNPLTGRYVDEEIKYGEMYLSDDPAEAAQGIFKGYIDLDLKVSDYENIRVTQFDEDRCNIDLGAKIDRSYPLRLHYSTQCTYEVGYTEYLSYSYLNNGVVTNKIIHGDSIQSQENICHSYIDSKGNFSVIYFSALKQGFKRDSEYIYKSEIYMHRIYDKDNNILLEKHYATPPTRFPDFVSYKPDISPLRFNEILEAAKEKPWCYGAVAESDKFNIKAFNLTLDELNLNNDDGYFINAIKELNTDYPFNYFSFIHGVYTAFVDPLNKLVYYALRDGKGYYLIDLGDKINNLNYFGFNSENEIIVGEYIEDGKGGYNVYSIIPFQLIRTDIKPTKIVYDFNKLNIAFIPCLTHCMAKGGIVSKVY